MNHHQHAADMPVAGLNGHGTKVSLEDQIKSYSDNTPENSVEANKYGSRLNHKTGQLDARSSKAGTITDKNLNPSPEYLNGYDATVWDHDRV